MKLIQTKEYLLLIDEEARIYGGDALVAKENNEFIINFIPELHNKDKYSKIIAYFPLTKDPKELDLPLLPNPFREEVNVEKFVQDFCKESENINYDAIRDQVKVAFIQKDMELIYKAAQSKQFSFKDVDNIVNSYFEVLGPNQERSAQDLASHLLASLHVLSTQQLPKEFEPKYRPKHVYGEGVLKIEKNSEGKEVIQGTYKY